MVLEASADEGLNIRGADFCVVVLLELEEPKALGVVVRAKSRVRIFWVFTGRGEPFDEVKAVIRGVRNDHARVLIRARSEWMMSVVIIIFFCVTSGGD